jgi:hypothetical protein
MAKLITLKESELFNMVKTIVEQVEMDLSQYDDNDFTDVFVFLFRNWITKKLGEDSKKYPFSFLLNKYGKEFLQDTLGDKYDQYYGDREEIYFNGYNSIPKTGKVLVKSGAFTLPSLRQQEKFTEKYAKHLPRIIKMMRFPDFVRVEFEEEVPYDVHVELYIDYPSYLKDESFSFASHNLERKFKELLENYLGVDFGNPVHGKVNLTLYTNAENVEKWVKQVLNKEIKKHIKEMPGGKNIHSIRFEPSISGSSEMKIVYKDGSHRHMHQWEFLRGVRDYINSLGYKRISADNA